MKRFLIVLSVGLLVWLVWIASAKAQTIPQRAKISAAVGSPAAAVSCGPAAPSGSTLPLVNHLTGYTVMCGKASGTTSEATVTVTGLSGGTATLGYIDESQTGVSFIAEDLTYPAIAASGSSAITISMPAVTNGGPCTCVAIYAQY